MTTVKLCGDVFFESDKRFPVYLNSVKNIIGQCKTKEGSLVIEFLDGGNYQVSKYYYIITPNPNDLPQNDFHALMLVD